jgi:hypothetical protein
VGRPNKLFDRRLATKEDFERWQQHDQFYEVGMIVKVTRRRFPAQLIEKLYLGGRLGIWFEARSILGGPTYRVATDQIKRVLCEMEALAWAAR